jgi:hypothetical protein
MIPEQLSLFSEPSDAVNSAIAKLTNSRGRNPKFNAYVSDLGSLMSAKPAGSLIIAVVPNGQSSKQVCASLEDYFEDAKSCGVGWGKACLATLEIPHVSSRQILQRQLADLYTALPASKIGHIHEPQFTFDSMSGYARPSPMQQICGLIRGRARDYYLVPNAHYLSPSGSSIADGVNQVRFFIQLASQSGKTHVLFTNAATARDWLGNGEITNEVSTRWLKPYNRKDKASFLEFKGILKGYDALLPRETGFTLTAHAKEICDMVWGCTYRLNKWAVNALVAVRACGGDQVTWNDFCQCAPSPTETTQAEKEFSDIQAMMSPLASTTTGAASQQQGTKSKVRLAPGQRRLTRDVVGQDENAA